MADPERTGQRMNRRKVLAVFGLAGTLGVLAAGEAALAAGLQPAAPTAPGKAPTPDPTATTAPTRPRRVELQGVDTPYHYVDANGNNGTDWFSNNTPDPDLQERDIGTVVRRVYDKNTGALITDITFSLRKELYPEIPAGATTNIGIGGIIEDVPYNHTPMITGISSQDDRAWQKVGLEVLLDSSNPDGDRIRYWDGLIPDVNNGGGAPFKDFQPGSDEKGEYWQIDIDNAVDPAKNGSYRIYKDKNGLPIKPTVNVTANVTPVATSTPAPAVKPVYIPNFSNGSPANVPAAKKP